MFLDAQLQFSDSQAVTTSATGTNVVDLSVDRSIGNGEPVGVVFAIEVDADIAGGTETYLFEVEYSSDSAQSTDRQIVGRRSFSATPVAPAQDASLLVEGFRVIIPIPPTVLSESEQFIGIRYATGGDTPSVTVSAYLQPMSMIDATNDYTSGFVVS